MIYPNNSVLIDVTKYPYNVDNTGKTTVHISSSVIGNKISNKPLYEIQNSEISIFGMSASGFNKETEYNIIIKDNDKMILWDDLTQKDKKHYRILEKYKNYQL